MNTYKASFYGRKRYAIGIFYLINTEVIAENSEKALIKLYELYEHITRLKLEIIKKD